MTTATQHKDQRVGVFVDVSNMYYSARQLYRRKVNFNAILKEAVAGRRLVRAFAYAIRTDVSEEPKFHEALERAGFDVRLKDLQVFFGGAKKGDWDVGIAMDIVRYAQKLDVIVLVSGDGDFQDLFEYASSLGCRCEVISFEKTTSNRLVNAADQVTFMDNNTKIFLWSSTGADSRHVPPEGPQQKRPPQKRPQQKRPALKRSAEKGPVKKGDEEKLPPLQKMPPVPAKTGDQK